MRSPALLRGLEGVQTYGALQYLLHTISYLLAEGEIGASHRDGLQPVSMSPSNNLLTVTPTFVKHISPIHTVAAQHKVEGGQTTGYGSSQVEQDRTGGKPQTGPKPTEHGTVRRPGIPSREDSAGRDPDKTRPRTGTTGGDPNEMMPGKTPPGYDKSKPRPATATEQGATDQMQGKNQGMGHLGSDPTKDTGGPKPDYGNKDPQKDVDEEGLVGRGNMHDVDSGDTAGMPKDAKPASGSPAEHHEGKRQAKGSAGSGDSWDPSSDTPSLDKGARVTDPRTPREERSGLSPTDGPPEGSPEPGSYVEELTKNVRPNETPDGPQEMPPKVPSAINPQQPKGS
ncbi:MAG: hypothetical protein FRX49_12884 [Trebouxia sp. A1-2]|nr:MAG: hypothetical protein FRX49_12884 [Trebouxia sp. A1-2]